MDRQRKIVVVRSLASAATAAGLVFASWSTPANAASKSDYHGVDVAALRSNVSVVSGPVTPMRVNSDLFSPRDSKEQKTKNPSKGTGSKSKKGGSATGTKSATKQKSKDGSVTKGTGSKNTASNHAAKAPTADSVTKGTGSKNTTSKNGVEAGAQQNNAKSPTADSVTKGTGSKNTMSKNGVAAGAQQNDQNNAAPAGIQIFTPQQTGTAGTNTAPLTTGAVPGTNTAPLTTGAVHGVQENNTPGAMNNGAATLAGVVGQQANGVVAGVQSLPSTSTAEAANLAGAGLALIASGGSILVIKRRRK